jgi:dTDP-4-dehydrorhamnose 3,5-epimerase
MKDLLSGKQLFEGCGIYSIPTHYDHRGSFIKTYHPYLFREIWPEELTLRETFVSHSKKGVLRGFHFQTPPYQQWKVVCCLAGEVLDVLLDLRRNSATFRKTCASKISGPRERTSGQVKAIVIPPGVGHAFYTPSSEAFLFYGVSQEYVPDSDLGVLWSSVDFEWPSRNPILSERDAGFPTLSDFRSPF